MNAPIEARRTSALLRRKKELKFWESANPTTIDVKMFGKSAKHLTNLETKDHKPTPTDLKDMVDMKINICEKDIKNLEAKIKTQY
jgi:hypothetical protein